MTGSLSNYGSITAGEIGILIKSNTQVNGSIYNTGLVYGGSAGISVISATVHGNILNYGTMNGGIGLLVEYGTLQDGLTNNGLMHGIMKV